MIFSAISKQTLIILSKSYLNNNNFNLSSFDFVSTTTTTPESYNCEHLSVTLRESSRINKRKSSRISLYFWLFSSRRLLNPFNVKSNSTSLLLPPNFYYFKSSNNRRKKSKKRTNVEFEKFNQEKFEPVFKSLSPALS
jgi:hypothetical protein